MSVWLMLLMYFVIGFIVATLLQLWIKGQDVEGFTMVMFFYPIFPFVLIALVIGFAIEKWVILLDKEANDD